MHRWIAVVLLVAFASEARAVTIAWSPVGNPGNANDPASRGVYGGVPYNYNIGTYDVTNSQYVEFLNAKDPNGTSPLQLYNSDMSLSNFSGVSFNNLNPGGSKYVVISGAGNHPVNFVTWYDTLRFANWINNGQGNGDTESGAYTLLGGTPTPSNGDSITRNAGATVFLPSENEWYKAAFYNPANSSYFQYPTRSNIEPVSSPPTGLPNHANFGPLSSITDVGAYTGTTSPYGAFDMGSDVRNWDETLLLSAPGVRGGAFTDLGAFALKSSYQNFLVASFETNNVGFRLASVPEPSSFVLAAFAAIGLAAWAWRRRG